MSKKVFKETEEIFKALNEREKNFWRNFYFSKSGNTLADMMNLQQDIKVYGYIHNRYLEVLGEKYL